MPHQLAAGGHGPVQRPRRAGVGGAEILRGHGVADTEDPARLGGGLAVGRQQDPYRAVARRVHERAAESGAQGGRVERRAAPAARVHHGPPLGPEQGCGLRGAGPQQQPYEGRAAARRVDALVGRGEQGQQDDGDPGDGVVSRFPPGGAEPEDEPLTPPRAYAARWMPSTVSLAELGAGRALPSAASGTGGLPGPTTPASRARARRASGDGARPAADSSVPSAASSTAWPPTRDASWVRTAGTGSGRAAAAARPCCACVTLRSSRWRASAISRHTARATAVKVVGGGTSSSGRPCRSHASTSSAGTVSYTGVTPKPSAAAPAATMRET